MAKLLQQRLRRLCLRLRLCLRRRRPSLHPLKLQYQSTRAFRPVPKSCSDRLSQLNRKQRRLQPLHLQIAWSQSDDVH